MRARRCRRSGATPSTGWRRSKSRSWLELEVLERRRVGEAGNGVGPGHLDARPDAPDEGEVVDGHVQHVLGHGLLHLMHEGLALLGVHLAGLAREEIVDLWQRAVSV